jgi:acetyl esterase/lipase
MLLTLLFAQAVDPHAWALYPGDVPGEKPDYYTNESTHNWPAGRVVFNVSRPTVVPFLVPNATAAVVIAPGGAYKWLTWDAEGVDIAQWANSIGLSAFVLKYRVPFRPWLMQPGYGHTYGEGPLIDAQRAMGMVRGKAASLGLNSSRIGFMGFSAGGHLAAHISTNNTRRAYPRIDGWDDVPCRPDFALMVYPAYLVNETVAGDTRGLSQLMLNVSADHPTAFLAQTEDDGVHCENSINYYLALKAAKAPPSELHVYPDRNREAQHGYGRCLRPPVHDNEVCSWPVNAAAFLRRLGVAPSTANGTARTAASYGTTTTTTP